MSWDRRLIAQLLRNEAGELLTHDDLEGSDVNANHDD